MPNVTRKQDLREVIADAIADSVKSYDVADVCVRLFGLDPPASPYDDPFKSKRVYVRSRLMYKPIDELEELARKVIDEYGDRRLSKYLHRRVSPASQAS